MELYLGARKMRMKPVVRPGRALSAFIRVRVGWVERAGNATLPLTRDKSRESANATRLCTSGEPL
jgi:hypothetical protein